MTFAVLAVGFVPGPADPPPARAAAVFGSDRYRTPDPPRAAAPAADGSRLYTPVARSSGGEWIDVWNLADGTRRRVAGTPNRRADADDRRDATARLSADGTRLVGVTGGTVRAWDAATGKPVTTPGPAGPGAVVAFAPGDAAVVVAADGAVQVRPLTGPAVTVGPAHPGAVAVVSPDGTTVVAAEPAGRDAPTRLVEYATRPPGRRVVLETGAAGFVENFSPPVVRAAVLPDGRVVTAVDGRGLRVWDGGTGRPAAESAPPDPDAGPDGGGVHGRRFGPLLASADGRTVYAGTRSGVVRRFVVATLAEAGPLAGHAGLVTTLNLTAAGDRLVTTAEDGVVRRWDTATGAELPPPAGYAGGVRSRVSPDGRLVLLSDATGRVDLCVAWSGGRVRAVKPPGPAEPDTSPLGFGFLGGDRRVYTAARDGTETVHEAATGRVAAEFVPPAGPDRLFDFSPTPDGTALVHLAGAKSGGPTNRLVRHDFATGRRVWASPELTPAGAVSAPAFSPDGRAVYGGVSHALPARPADAGGPRYGLALVSLDAATGAVVRRADLADPGWLAGLSDAPAPPVSADGSTAVLRYFTLAAVDTRTGAAGPTLDARSIAAATADGRFLLSGGRGGVVRWAAARGRVGLAVPTDGGGTYDLHLLPGDRQVLVSGPGGRAAVYDPPPWPAAGAGK